MTLLSERKHSHGHLKKWVCPTSVQTKEKQERIACLSNRKICYLQLSMNARWSTPSSNRHNLLHVWAATSEQVFISRLSLSPILTATVTKSTRASSSTVWFSSTSHCSRTCTDDCQFLPTTREPCDNKLRIKQSKEVCLQSLAVSYSFDLKIFLWETVLGYTPQGLLFSFFNNPDFSKQGQTPAEAVWQYFVIFWDKKKMFSVPKKTQQSRRPVCRKGLKSFSWFFFCIWKHRELSLKCLQSLLFKDKTNIQRNIFTLQFTQVTLIQQKITLEKVIFLKEATFVPN